MNNVLSFVRYVKFTLTLCFLAFFSVLSLNLIHAQQQTPTASTINVNIETSTSKVELNGTFKIDISVTNTGDSSITDVELRVPMLNQLRDTEVSSVNPSFNKILESDEYPAGFQDRSWIINNFEAGQSKQYSITYQVSDEPENLTGIVLAARLPATWNDPVGLQSNRDLELKYQRVDLYSSSNYIKSFQAPLPTLEGLETELSLIELSGQFAFEGSQTTNLRQVNKDNISNFPDFTLDTPEVLIKWTSPVDLSGENVPGVLRDLESVLLVSDGKFTIDANRASFLQASVNITFKDINLLNPPKVKVGNDIKDLDAVSGKWDETKETVFLSENIINDTAILPNIIIDEGTLQIDSEEATIEGKVSEPNATLEYRINDGDYTRINNVDVSSGEFSINLQNLKDRDEVQLQMTSRITEEKITKSILIKSTQPTEVEEEYTQENEEDDTFNLSPTENPLILPLLLALVIVLLLIVGYVYYLYHKKKSHSKKEKGDTLKREIKDLSMEAIQKRKQQGISGSTIKDVDKELNGGDKYKKSSDTKKTDQPTLTPRG